MIKNEQDFKSASQEERQAYFKQSAINMIRKHCKQTEEYLVKLAEEAGMLKVPLFTAYISIYEAERKAKKFDQGGSLGVMVNQAYLQQKDIREILGESLDKLLGLKEPATYLRFDGEGKYTIEKWGEENTSATTANPIGDIALP
jgi:hypothetical protein